MEGEIAYRGKNIDHFPLHLALEHIAAEVDRVVVIESEFLRRLAVKSFLYIFAIVHVATHSGVPSAGKKILLHRAFLQIQLGIAVDDMKMDNRMKEEGAPVTIHPGRLSIHDTVLPDDRKHLAGMRNLY